MRLARHVALGVLPALLSCGAPAAKPTTPAAPPATATAAASATAPASTTPPPSADFDPVPLGMTADGAQRLCDDHLAKAKGLVDDIDALAGAPADRLTWDATLGRFDLVALEISNANDFLALMAVAHPDGAVREAAKACQPKASAFYTALYLDPKLGAVVRAYAAKKEPLEGSRARLLSDTLRDFRRNGLELAPADQQKLRDLSTAISERETKFQSNIADSRGTVVVPKSSLDGLPADYVAAHPPDAKGMVTISTDYPDYFPFITYAKDRAAAKDLYVQFMNRGGDANVKLLDELLALRAQKAKLLGYPSWAAYQVEPRMAKTPENVQAFLGRVRNAVKAPAKKEHDELVAEHVALGGKATDVLSQADRFYLVDRVRQKKYALDSQAVSEYFELGATLKGMLDVTAQMYGIEYKPVAANAWHEDVTAYEVWSGGRAIGKFYLDLYSRPNKYKHMATFGVRSSRKMEDGSWQTPVAALEGNFPKPSADHPALLSHHDASTLFHEFGHVLHAMLSTQELASYAGSRTTVDFVEVPSQMFEEWTWNREVLDRFARHYKTGEKMPDAMFQAMKKARTFGLGIETERQLFLASLDFEYHSRAPGFDTTQVLREVTDANDPYFPWVPGTHFQSSFGHIAGGYDAGYYGYQWALALSQDVVTRFRAHGFLDPETDHAWRDIVLANGGGIDEKELVTKFLGRPPSEDAYAAFLRGEEPR